MIQLGILPDTRKVLGHLANFLQCPVGANVSPDHHDVNPVNAAASNSTFWFQQALIPK